MNFLTEINSYINKYYILVSVLLIGAIVFVVILRAYSLNFWQMFKTLKKSNKKAKVGISGFQSLMLSTASRIGNGNIAGVAFAIMVGGPGALFWMWVIAILGMSTAFAEGVLAQVYKQKWGDKYVGGTPFYIAKRSGKRFVKVFATIYAVFAIITFGISYIGVQSNTIASNFESVITPLNFNIDRWVIKLIAGIVVASIMLLITFRGIKSIGKFSSIVMPIMGSLYLAIALVVIFMNIGKTGEVWTYIFENAFGSKQMIGGIGGYSIARAIQYGISKGAFSNEAGLGSASFSAAASNSKHPVQQGLLQSLSTFIDTIIICTASGFIILYAGVYKGFDGNSGTLIQESIAAELGGGPARWFVFICVFLFGITTSVGLYYYSEIALKFITKKKIYTIIWKIIVCGGIIYFAVQKVAFVWDIELILTSILVCINVPFLISQSKNIANLVKDYKLKVSLGKPIEFEYYCDKVSKS